jgi:glycosyltransferase involved in cell wall biosynthesis
LSVIIPAYNAAAFVNHAVLSVLESAPEAEVIVVDDGSADDTVARLAGQSPAIRVVRHESNRGLPAALNSGVRASRGAWIGFCDADDVWLGDRRPAELALLEEAPAPDIVWGRTQVRFTDKTGSLYESSHWPPQSFPALGSMLFARHVFDRVGLFDTALRHAQDIDFLARCREAQLRIVTHPTLVLEWRRHGGNMTNQVTVDRDYFVSAIRSALGRRRGTPAGTD